MLQQRSPINKQLWFEKGKLLLDHKRNRMENRENPPPNVNLREGEQALLTELHEILVSTPLQPVEVPLDSSMTFW